MKKTKEIKELRIDLGAGSNPREGFISVDKYKMKGVDVVLDIGKEKWPWKDNSVDEAHAAHFLEHLTNFNNKWERTHFFNELYRVLKKGAKAQIIIPHWCSNRYYGDPTHCEPFSEMGFYYLSKEWRLGKDGVGANAPHSDKKWNKNGYDCDFECTWGYSLRQDLLTRNQEFQQNAISTQKEAAQDIIATCTKK
jgi:Methyltransferase domain